MKSLFNFIGSPAVLVAILLSGTFFTAPALLADDSSATPSVAEKASGQLLYELRIYTAVSGKMPVLHKRFRDHTLRLFEKHGIKSVGYWTAADENAEERLYYMVSYPDRESREKMLVQGIARDPEFLQVVAESTKDGELTSKIESVLLSPTDYSPLK